ncbi:MAG: hypothetical protein FD155_28 [Bacteroidetes bacterium]|nr:MAG: hypothetical protein FD155_28 [Bacteroidota bacterium]
MFQPFFLFTTNIDIFRYMPLISSHLYVLQIKIFFTHLILLVKNTLILEA